MVKMLRFCMSLTKCLATKQGMTFLPLEHQQHHPLSRVPISRTSHGYRKLVHLPDELVDTLLTVAQVAALDEMLELPRPKPAGWVAQLERPQKVARLLEVRADSDDLMDQILHAHDPIFPQVILDDLVVGEGDALLVDLAVAALVDEGADGLEVRVAVGDVGLDDLEHFRGGFGEADEDAVVDLEEAQELEDLAGFGSDFVDTARICERGEVTDVEWGWGRLTP